MEEDIENVIQNLKPLKCFAFVGMCFLKVIPKTMRILWQNVAIVGSGTIENVHQFLTKFSHVIKHGSVTFVILYSQSQISYEFA